MDLDQQSASSVPPSQRRRELLHEALLCASAATQLAPGSLSSAALRATLLVNLLVEESALQGGLVAPADSPADVQLPPGGGGDDVAVWLSADPAVRCADIKREFKAAIADCQRTLEHPEPLQVEPVITISDQHTRTCDPCCLVSVEAPARVCLLSH